MQRSLFGHWQIDFLASNYPGLAKRLKAAIVLAFSTGSPALYLKDECRDESQVD
jgi:hypothetical protein